MRNILYLIIIILAVAGAATYSLNYLSGKKLTEPPISVVAPVQKPEIIEKTAPLPETQQGDATDLYNRIQLLEENLNSKLGELSQTADKTEVLARFDQLSKELEADVTMMLSAVNKKEQWYRNEFYQILAAIAAVFIVLLSVMLVMYLSLRKMITGGAPALQPVSVPVQINETSEPEQHYAEPQDEEDNPVLAAVSSVSAGLAVKIADSKYLFDPEKAVKLMPSQKTALGEITEEILFLDKAGLKPGPEEYYLLGLERFTEKSMTEAAALFEHTKSMDDSFALAWYMAGHIAYSSKKYEAAYDSLSRACVLESDNFLYLTAYGNACLKVKKYDEAADAFLNASKTAKADASVFNSLAHAYILDGRTEKAAEAFAKAADIKPDFHEALHNLGLALSRLNKYEEAAQAFEKAIAAKPDKHESMYNAACVYALLGKRAESLRHLKKAVEISSDYAKKAKQDKDFASFADDAEFASITG